MLTTSPPAIVPTLQRDAALAVGEPVQLDDLAGDLLDRADAVGEVVAGMRRLAGDVEPHEDAALAAGDDAAVRPARLGVEHRAGAARLLLDQRARRRRADLLVGGEQRRPAAPGAPNFANADSTSAFIARPAFMSQQPGPEPRPSAMRNGRRAASPRG